MPPRVYITRRLSLQALACSPICQYVQLPRNTSILLQITHRRYPKGRMVHSKPTSTHILAATSTRAIRPALKFASAPFRIASTTLRMALSKSDPERVVLMIFCKSRWDSSTSGICQFCHIHLTQQPLPSEPCSPKASLSCKVHATEPCRIRARQPRRQTSPLDVS